MAAGKGTRMRSRTPKVLHRIAGVPMVAHVTRTAKRLQPAAVIVVVAPEQRDAIAEAAGDGVECAEQPEPLGTGHALTTALKQVTPDATHVLLLNGDVPLLKHESLQALMDRHVANRAALSLLTATLPTGQAAGLGTVRRNSQGVPIAVVEAAEASAAKADDVEVNVGAYCFSAPWLREAASRLQPHPSGEYYVTDLVATAALDGQWIETHALEDAGEGMGINDRAQLACAESGLQWRMRLSWMERGVTMEDPQTTYLEPDVELDEDVTLLPNTSLRGRTYVAGGATVGPNVTLTDATIGAGCVVQNATLEGAVLESNVDVGPYSYLRPGTHVESGAHIGSHVEIKNSRIGADSNVGHFSYIGDATLGPRVNIGAGTVTCNYDGVDKHRTEIGADAFIGSDSMLVAPVKIGDGAVTGAGAVVTEDVAPGATVAGVPARELSRSSLKPNRTGA
jgi:bifunctional UDP-N-acetylglucosamine pyrophosphorylase / glucosamine-1-phosphate N-acetyltransferase